MKYLCVCLCVLCVLTRHRTHAPMGARKKRNACTRYDNSFETDRLFSPYIAGELGCESVLKNGDGIASAVHEQQLGRPFVLQTAAVAVVGVLLFCFALRRRRVNKKASLQPAGPPTKVASPSGTDSGYSSSSEDDPLLDPDSRPDRQRLSQTPSLSPQKLQCSRERAMHASQVRDRLRC